MLSIVYRCHDARAFEICLSTLSLNSLGRNTAFLRPNAICGNPISHKDEFEEHTAHFSFASKNIKTGLRVTVMVTLLP